MTNQQANEPNEVIERLLPHMSERVEVLRVFADSIRLAHATGADRWGISLLSDRLRLNVGQVVVCAIEKNGIWLALDRDAIPEQELSRLREARAWQSPVYRGLRSSASIVVEAEQLASIVPQVWQAHQRLIELAAEKYGILKDELQHTHAEKVIDLLRRDLQFELPHDVQGRTVALGTPGKG
jgi:hypothetical protein